MSVGSISAQFQKTLFQSFELSDTINSLNLELSGTVQIESWVGSAILIETKVEMDNGNATLFKFLQETGRYLIEEVRVDSTLVVRSKFKERPIVGNQYGNISEVVNLKVLLPDSYILADSTRWVKKKE